MLRAAREQQGLSLDDVAARTRVRPALLRALEEGRYDALPGPVYTRGFLKLYARAVGLDPAAVVAAWEQEAQARPGSAPKPMAPKPPQRERPRPWWHPDPVLQSMDPRQRLRSAVSATLVVVLAAVVGAWLLSAATKGPAQDVPHPELSLEPAAETRPGGVTGPAGGAGGLTGVPGESLALPPASAPSTASPSAPAEPGNPAVAGAGRGAGPAVPVAAPGPAEGQAAVQPTPQTVPAPIAPEASGPARQEGGRPGVEVVAIVREPGWIEAFADGQRIYSSTARAGERLTWRAREILSLRLERAEGVDLVVNGQPVGPAGWGVTTRHFRASTEENRP